MSRDLILEYNKKSDNSYDIYVKSLYEDQNSPLDSSMRRSLGIYSDNERIEINGSNLERIIKDFEIGVVGLSRISGKSITLEHEGEGNLRVEEDGRGYGNHRNGDVIDSEVLFSNYLSKGWGCRIKQ